MRVRKLSLVTVLVGVLCLAMAAVASANMVANGGFETGDFTGWTQSGNTGFTSVTGGSFALSGLYGAALGPVGSDGYLSQTLATTMGRTYAVSFYLKSPGGTPNDFTVLWEGSDVGPDLVNAGVFPWTYYYGFLTAGMSGSELKFEFRQDPSYWALDNVYANVPLPPSMLLLGSGLLGLLGLRRFSKP